MFVIDSDKYKVIDISHTVVPGEDVDRPFAIQKALLQDKSFRYDILKTHSHVGTHVEVGVHFYEGGKSITDYALETFYDSGILFSVKEMKITDRIYQREIGGEIQD